MLKTIWADSEMYEFNGWYLEELRVCMTRGFDGMRRRLVAQMGAGIEKMGKLLYHFSLTKL
jgi:hypothetical protein